MKIQRIYVDTSVIGGCFDPEFKKWSNGLFRDFKENRFIPVLSEIVTDEIEEAPVFVQDKYAELIECNAEFIEVDQIAINLLHAYQHHGILGKKYRNDMLHIAVATIAGVDMLTSWNFKHIVRFDKIRSFNAVNLENGYKQLEIYSPREITNYGDN